MELPLGAQQEMSRGSSPSELFCAAGGRRGAAAARRASPEHTGPSEVAAVTAQTRAARLASPQRKKRGREGEREEVLVSRLAAHACIARVLALYLLAGCTLFYADVTDLRHSGEVAPRLSRNDVVGLAIDSRGSRPAI